LNTATATAGSGLRLDRMIRQVAASVPGALPPEQLEGELRKATSKVVDFVIAYGNVFPERAYVVNVGGVGPRSQGLAVVASGPYEREVLEKGLGANGSGWTRSEVAGVGVYTSTGMKIALLDGQTVMVLPARESHFPLEDVLKNLKEKTSSLRSEPRWARFLDALKPDPGVRALAITDETLMAEMREEVRREGSAPQEVRDGVLGMQELELTSGLLDDGKARVRVEASFQEEKEARGLVEFLKAQVATGITMLEQFSGSPEAPPVMKKGIEVLKAVHLAAEGKKGIARLEMDPLKFEELPALMGGVMLRTVPLER
jgi:hypothetical protein